MCVCAGDEQPTPPASPAWRQKSESGIVGNIPENDHIINVMESLHFAVPADFLEVHTCIFSCISRQKKTPSWCASA